MWESNLQYAVVFIKLWFDKNSFFFKVENQRKVSASVLFMSVNLDSD